MLTAPRSWVLFWRVYPFVVLILVAAFGTYAFWSIDDDLREIREEEQQIVALQVSEADRDLDNVAAFACTLARQNELNDAALRASDGEEFEEMAVEFLDFVLNLDTYDQIRFIGGEGEEFIRVNSTLDGAEIAPSEDLKDSLYRYYVTEALQLNFGEVYASQLDLAARSGVVEMPLKPTIRFATPVEGMDEEIAGIVVVNYLAEDFLRNIAAIGEVSNGDPVVLNEEGYWLLSPDPSLSWGFMFENGIDRRMEVLFPEAWQRMQEGTQGQFRTSRGLFTYQVYEPYQQVRQCAHFNPDLPRTEIQGKDHKWYFTSHVSQQTLRDLEGEVFVLVSAIAFPVLILGGVVVRQVGRAVEERHALKVEARTDMLTRLANRTALNDAMEMEILRADRYERCFGILYLDLDGFKSINDSLGHAAGDEMLKSVADLLLKRQRKSDIVARVGGDEFVILLCETCSKNDAMMIASRIIIDIKSVEVQGSTIGVSIGAALWPQHGRTVDDLLKAADAALYRAKRQGKGRVEFASTDEA